MGIVIGPAAVLAGGGLGLWSAGAGSADGRLLGEERRPTLVELELLGASGVLPTVQELRPAVVATMVAPGDPAAVPPNSISIPPVVLDAYHRAERILAQRAPDCGVSWSLLAGVGRVVSDHARGGGLDKRGTTTGPILGPSLDGSPGTAEIADTDDGRLDGDRTWDRAAGPMQIIPVVWRRVGADSDREGTADPHNVYDASLAAGRYLCGNGADLSTPDGQVRAVFRYQRSEPFVRSTMLWTRVYDAASPAPPAADEIAAVPPAEAVTLSGESPPTPERLPSGPVREPVSVLSPEAPAPPGSTPAPPPPPRRTPSPDGGVNDDDDDDGGDTGGSPLPDGPDDDPGVDPTPTDPTDQPTGDPLPEGDGNGPSGTSEPGEPDPGTSSVAPSEDVEP